MDPKIDKTARREDRRNDLLAWWAMAADGNSGIEGQARRLQLFTADLQKAYGNACSRHMEALFAANEQLVRSFQGLLRVQRPDELMAAESDILATLMEAASLQARTWIELGETVQDRCLAMAREAADEMCGRHQEERSTTSQSEPARQPLRRTSKEAAHT